MNDSTNAREGFCATQVLSQISEKAHQFHSRPLLSSYCKAVDNVASSALTVSRSITQQCAFCTSRLACDSRKRDPWPMAKSPLRSTLDDCQPS